MSGVRVQLLFSFTHDGIDYPCTLVEWFKKVGRSPDTETGMWVVEPEMQAKSQLTSIVCLDIILCSAHLIPVYGAHHIPVNFQHMQWPQLIVAPISGEA
jgi:hypothetical protein